ncbi:MAG: LysE family translocator [Bacteroidetes bacterium]|nr:LysE family translocator [Bacteroidota bacterium]
MPQAIRILGWGFIISFIGTLPLGTLSISAMQIAMTDGVPPAISFSLGAITAEMIYVRISLVAMSWVRSHEKFLKVLEWAAVVIVMGLAVSSFWSAMHPAVPKNVLLSATMHRGLLGLLMSAINPMQIPFWFGWSAVLFSKNILSPGFWNYNAYLFGIGAGTFIAHCLFMFGGRWLGEQLNSGHHYMNWAIGFIFFVTGIIQLIKIYTKKDAIHQLEHPEEVTGGLEKKIH